MKCDLFKEYRDSHISPFITGQCSAQNILFFVSSRVAKKKCVRVEYESEKGRSKVGGVCGDKI